MTNYQIPLVPGGIYYLMARANGDEMLFRHEENYRFFLERTEMRLSSIVTFLAYSLIPSQIHFVVQVKPEELIRQHFEIVKAGKIWKDADCPDFIMRQFSNLFNSYAKSYNKFYGRLGSLFVDSVRRSEILSLAELQKTILDVHKRPAHYGCCKDIFQWRWSSLWSLTNRQSSLVANDRIEELFGSMDLFQILHMERGFVPGSLVRA